MGNKSKNIKSSTAQLLFFPPTLSCSIILIEISQFLVFSLIFHSLLYIGEAPEFFCVVFTIFHHHTSLLCGAVRRESECICGRDEELEQTGRSKEKRGENRKLGQSGATKVGKHNTALGCLSSFDSSLFLCRIATSSRLKKSFETLWILHRFCSSFRAVNGVECHNWIFEAAENASTHSIWAFFDVNSPVSPCGIRNFPNRDGRMKNIFISADAISHFITTVEFSSIHQRHKRFANFKWKFQKDSPLTELAASERSSSCEPKGQHENIKYKKVARQHHSARVLFTFKLRIFMLCLGCFCILKFFFRTSCIISTALKRISICVVHLRFLLYVVYAYCWVSFWSNVFGVAEHFPMLYVAGEKKDRLAYAGLALYYPVDVPWW